MNKTIEVVSIYDPSLDRRAMDLAKYAGTQAEPAERDPSLIRTLPGREPVRFKLRALTKRQHDLCDSQGPIGARDTALAFGLEAIIVPGREAMRPPVEVPAEGGGVVSIWDEVALAALQDELGRDVMRELAHVIVMMSPSLGKIFGGGDVHRFSLPPLWLLEAERSARIPAA